MKEKLSENLRNEVLQKIRTERKNKQQSIALKAIFLLYVVFIVLALIFLPQSLRSVHVIYGGFTITCAAALFIVILGAVILPVGKEAELNIDEGVKELVATKIKSKTENLSQIKSNVAELEQELEILTEL